MTASWSTIDCDVHARGSQAYQASLRCHARAALRHFSPQQRAEIVSLRATVTGIMRKPPQRKIGRGQNTPPAASFGGKRPVYFGGRFRAPPIFRRAALLGRNRISGPALIEEHASTTLLMPVDTLEVDASGNLAIAVRG